MIWWKYYSSPVVDIPVKCFTYSFIYSFSFPDVKCVLTEFTALECRGYKVYFWLDGGWYNASKLQTVPQNHYQPYGLKLKYVLEILLTNHTCMGKYPAWCFFPPQDWACWFCSCLRKNRDAWFAELVLVFRQHSSCHLTCCWHRAQAPQIITPPNPTEKTNILPKTCVRKYFKISCFCM